MRILPEPEGQAPGLDGASPDGDGHGSASHPLLEISNATVRLYKAAFGRGPTQARARFAGTDTLVVLLHDTMTISERKLAELGEHERLRQDRLLLHQAVEPQIRMVVERILDRPTVGLICGIDTYRDMAAEVILLAPDRPHGPEAPV
jgi:uncharacterized protein YbcI